MQLPLMSAITIWQNIVKFKKALCDFKIFWGGKKEIKLTTISLRSQNWYIFILVCLFLQISGLVRFDRDGQWSSFSGLVILLKNMSFTRCCHHWGWFCSGVEQSLVSSKHGPWNYSQNIQSFFSQQVRQSFMSCLVFIIKLRLGSCWHLFSPQNCSIGWLTLGRVLVVPIFFFSAWSRQLCCSLWDPEAVLLTLWFSFD